MLGYIVLLWIVIKMQAPLWCYVLIIGAMLIKVLDLILKFIKFVLDKRIKEITDDLDTMQ